jgi:hypothetical protein
MALTTLNEVKTYLGISLSDTSRDALIETLRLAIEQSIVNYCETDFEQHALTGELHDGTRADTFVPKNFPILSVQAVIFNCDVDGTGGFTLDGDRDYYFDVNSINLRGLHTPQARGIVRIDYTYGYATVPADVKLVVYQSVKAELQRNDSNTEHISSRSKRDESESFGGVWDAKTGLPKAQLARLQPYRIIEFPNVSMAQRNL